MHANLSGEDGRKVDKKKKKQALGTSFANTHAAIEKYSTHYALPNRHVRTWMIFVLFEQSTAH